LFFGGRHLTALVIRQDFNTIPSSIELDTGWLENPNLYRVRNPKQKIIVLTVHNEQTFPKRLLEIGARGYLTKECGVDEMIKAIRQVHSG